MKYDQQFNHRSARYSFIIYLSKLCANIPKYFGMNYGVNKIHFISMARSANYTYIYSADNLHIEKNYII